MGQKIATCSYCGTRAILVLDKRRHELSCRACGAPLHDMKFMPKPVEKMPKPAPKKANLLSDGRHGCQAGWFSKERRNRKKKKRKPIIARVLEEVWDEVEDFFD